ncbi:spinocerebellar ataxia type 10 protein domain-containing protein [Lipomyces orientalis]|uniref:Spinocerebellar ataxia type 10 protein domain-containing protein n=1 Tax=Lipomyces orientalis TaxID=1233043 RepID=A0ACC3TTR3_9ASCO
MATLEEVSVFLNSLAPAGQYSGVAVLKRQPLFDESIARISAILNDTDSRITFGQSEDIWRSISSVLSGLRTVKLSADEESSRRYSLIRAILTLSMNLLAAGPSVQESASPYLKDELFCVLADDECIKQSLSAPCLKTLVNLCASNDNLLDDVWAAFVNQFDEQTLIRILRGLDDDSYGPLLIFIAGSIRSSVDRSVGLLNSSGGPILLNSILDKIDTWMKNEGLNNFELAYSVFEGLIRHSYFPLMYETASDSVDIPSERQVTLMRLLDAYLTAKNTDRNQLDLAEFLYNSVFCECKPLVVQVMTKKIGNIATERLALFILDVLECVTSVISLSEDTKSFMVNINSVREFLDLLKRTADLVPRRTLKSGNPDSQIPSYEFPSLKQKLVGILGIIVQDNKKVQDQIRDCGGLPVILSQCNIDDCNPFIREYAVLCIKGLLDNNEENQAFVASLEVREAVTSDALQEAGYETQIIDGKVALKRKDRT